MNRSVFILPFFLALVVLSSCSSDMWLGAEDDAAPLPGERLSILELHKTLMPKNKEPVKNIAVPKPWSNEFWPQAGGYPNHVMQNLSLTPDTLKKAWSTSIGKGSTRALPLTAQPIVFGDKVFTLDTHLDLCAFSVEKGKRLWKTDIQPENEDETVIGGGLSYASGTLYATNGFAELIALNPDNGQIKWRIDTTAPSRTAPTVIGNRIFVLTLDNRVMAYSAENRTLLWEHAGLNESAGLIGSASPAATQGLIVPAYSSGELYALHIENGTVAWSENFAPTKRIGGLDSLADIRALPVIDRDIVIAISFAGKLGAIDARSGRPLWQHNVGGAETPWVTGDYVFVLSSDNELIALARNTGEIQWIKQLPRFKDEEDKTGHIFWKGPVMAGSRLILAGTDGDVLEVSPANGDILRQWSTGDTITIAPVVAGSTLYLLDEDGTLTAFR